MPSSHSRVLFSSETVEIGRFTVRCDDPSFRTAGSIGGSIELVFPSLAVTIEQEGYRAFVADTSRIVWYQPWQQFERRPLARGGDRCDWIAFQPSVVESVLSRAGDTPYRTLSDLRGPGSDSPRIALRRARLFGALLAGLQDCALGIEEASLTLLQSAIHGGETTEVRRAPSVRDVEIADRARQVLGCSFTERLSLAQIAQEVGCSPFHLARTFRKVTGQSLHGFQNRLRLRSGLERLRDSAGDLSRLAHELGFSSHSHFSAAFRREYDVSPAALTYSLGSVVRQ